MKEEKFISYDNTPLHAYIFEVENPKGIVQIVHGVQENCKVYFKFAEFLNKNNYSVFMVDQRAHGKTCESPEEQGKVNGDVFVQSVKDQLYISNFLHDKYKLPIYVIGHSYGSFILQAYIKENKYAKKVIMLGTTFTKCFSFKLAKIVCKIFPKDKRANFSAKNIMTFWNKKFKDGNWICKKDEDFAKQNQTKNAPIAFTYGFYSSMFSNISKLYQDMNKINKNLPILVLSGKQDVISGYGKGIYKLEKVYDKNNLNAKFIVYPNLRHNILYSSKKDEVEQDIVNFLQYEK